MKEKTCLALEDTSKHSPHLGAFDDKDLSGRYPKTLTHLGRFDEIEDLSARYPNHSAHLGAFIEGKGLSGRYPKPLTPSWSIR